MEWTVLALIRITKVDQSEGEVRPCYPQKKKFSIQLSKSRGGVISA
jgi:hypothetical protein